MSYFPFKAKNQRPQLPRLWHSDSGFGLGHAPPASTPQPSGIWLVVQSASLLYPEAWYLGRRDQERLGILGFCHHTYQDYLKKAG